MTVGAPYRAAAPAPDIVHVRCLRDGDIVPARGAPLLRWYCLDIADDEARELARRGAWVALGGDRLLRHIEMTLPIIRGHAVEVHELSEQETRALPRMNFPAFGLYDV